MLAVDTSKRPSFARFIADGDLIIVYERHDAMKAVNVSDGSVFQNHFGVFKHAKGVIATKTDTFTYTLQRLSCGHWFSTIELKFFIHQLCYHVFGSSPGCLVLELGIGSRSLTTSLVRAVAHTGHVYTFDFHEQRAVSSREDFERTGVNSVVTVGVRDIQGVGFPEEFICRADEAFLDLPQPWLAIPSAVNMLRSDGTLCSFLSMH